jgi:hypothetical protein
MTTGKLTETLTALKQGLQNIVNQTAVLNEQKTNINKNLENLLVNKFATEGAIRVMTALIAEDEAEAAKPIVPDNVIEFPVKEDSIGSTD